MKCPICGKELIAQEPNLDIMDGNNVYQCEGDKVHRFWRHPFSFDMIHWNPKAEADDFDEYLSWKITLINHEGIKYELQPPIVKNIVDVVTLKEKYQHDLFDTRHKHSGVFKDVLQHIRIIDSHFRGFFNLHTVSKKKLLNVVAHNIKKAEELVEKWMK